jgi:precorrin-6A/cobalt-precorrin-6A reductase
VAAGPVRVLLLAGTTEAAALAALLADLPGVEVVASLAGRTTAPSPLPCEVRTGGFGGPEGLEQALHDGGFVALVDATHPFAGAMPHHAAAAAASAGVPRLRLVRPSWRPAAGDRWHHVDDLPAAAAALGPLRARRVFLTTGRLELAPFATVPGVHFVVRSIEPPDPMPLPAAASTVVLAQGPFTVDDELALLRAHRIDTLVTKNSGGDATAPKLAAARGLGRQVVMVRRPVPPPGPLAGTPEAAVRWLDALPVRR